MTRSGRQVHPPRGDALHGKPHALHSRSNNLNLPIPVYEDEMKVLGVIMTQLSLREGLKRFGERGKQGALKEMRQQIVDHGGEEENIIIIDLSEREGY
jgi:hypothetical protein